MSSIISKFRKIFAGCSGTGSVEVVCDDGVLCVAAATASISELVDDTDAALDLLRLRWGESVLLDFDGVVCDFEAFIGVDLDDEVAAPVDDDFLIGVEADELEKSESLDDSLMALSFFNTGDPVEVSSAACTALVLLRVLALGLPSKLVLLFWVATLVLSSPGIITSTPSRILASSSATSSTSAVPV